MIGKVLAVNGSRDMTSEHILAVVILKDMEFSNAYEQQVMLWQLACPGEVDIFSKDRNKTKTKEFTWTLADQMRCKHLRFAAITSCSVVFFVSTFLLY
jgi:hypothetical protein